MTHYSEANLESTVTELLRERADRAAVETNEPSPPVDRWNDERQGGGPARWWLAVAAVLVVMAGTGLALRDGSPPSDAAGNAPGREARQTIGAYDLVVWMDVDAEPSQVTDLAAVLSSSPAVDDFVHVDHAATWAEFVEYFADEPEIIDLVGPEDLPTSFRVRTGAPGSVVELIRNQAGVEEVEVGTPDD